jgi:hypothetical protein
MVGKARNIALDHNTKQTKAEDYTSNESRHEIGKRVVVSLHLVVRRDSGSVADLHLRRLQGQWDTVTLRYLQ